MKKKHSLKILNAGKSIPVQWMERPHIKTYSSSPGAIAVGYNIPLHGTGSTVSDAALPCQTVTWSDWNGFQKKVLFHMAYFEVQLCGASGLAGGASRVVSA